MIFIVFIQVILPILLVFLSGYLMQRKLQLNITAISSVAMYIFIPCLIFRTLYQVDMDLQYVYMILFFALFFIMMIMINKVYARIRKLPKPYESAYILTTAFMNMGNYGAPIILLAYGTAGFNFAVSLFVIQAFTTHTFGVYYAGRGKLKLIDILKKILELPMIYAVAVVLIFKGFGIQMPDNLFSVINLLASAAIPMVMVILGMQLAMISVKSFEWGSISYITAMRLLLSPILAYFLTLLFPFDPLLAKVLILSLSMPSAVVVTMYAIQFDAKPSLVSSATFINTLLSIVTITILLMLLK